MTHGSELLHTQWGCFYTLAPRTHVEHAQQLRAVDVAQLVVAQHAYACHVRILPCVQLDGLDACGASQGTKAAHECDSQLSNHATNTDVDCKEAGMCTGALVGALVALVLET